MHSVQSTLMNSSSKTINFRKNFARASLSKRKLMTLKCKKAALQEHLGLHEKGNGVGVEPQYPPWVEYWPELQNALNGQAETTSTLSSYESKNVCFRARGDAEPPYEDSLRVCKGEEQHGEASFIGAHMLDKGSLQKVRTILGPLIVVTLRSSLLIPSIP
jgi:hypothetical protein